MGTGTKLRIMIVDDDKQLLKELRTHLEKLGYEVACAEDGRTALKLAKTFYPSLVVLDMSFPEELKTKGRTLDGLEILQGLREIGNTPILMLSATNISAIKAMTLAAGADDYLAKPYDVHELSARIAAILRRGKSDTSEAKVLNFQRLRLDPGERRVWKDGATVDLTGIEFDIVYTIARRPQHVFTREKLIEQAWKGESFCVPKAVDVHIGHIRKKLEDDPTDPAFIVTVRGTGYRFEEALS